MFQQRIFTQSPLVIGKVKSEVCGGVRHGHQQSHLCRILLWRVVLTLPQVQLLHIVIGRHATQELLSRACFQGMLETEQQSSDLGHNAFGQLGRQPQEAIDIPLPSLLEASQPLIRVPGPDLHDMRAMSWNTTALCLDEIHDAGLCTNLAHLTSDGCIVSTNLLVDLLCGHRKPLPFIGKSNLCIYHQCGIGLNTTTTGSTKQVTHCCLQQSQDLL
mmetsp:Transcript_11967/g.26378  ORF Transcript_11967/g.26378 Transcript_11967/m.26378 type:complete len:216 (-) Transcript_11967:360-1007(-)